MLRPALAAFTILLLSSGQQPVSPSHNPPVCSASAVCFSGEVSAGQQFRHAIDDRLQFILEPQDRGWDILIAPRQPQPGCDEFAAVVTPPYRSDSPLDIDMSYGISAEQEVDSSPRAFSFVTNCSDYKTEFDRLQIVLWPYSYTEKEVDKATAALGTSPLGQGRLWITDSKISHAADTPSDKLGTIDWMRFTIEIRLPPHPAAPQ